MDRRQLVDKIVAIDAEIGRLRELNRSLEHVTHRRDADLIPEDVRQRSAQYHESVRRLTDEKRVLRIQISEI